MKPHWVICCLCCVMSLSIACAADALNQTTIFRAGIDGYHTYRIPAILRAKDGTVLAFAEGRKSGKGDSGEINLVLKRSSDDGRTFGPLEVVWADGPNTCGNPCPVLDEQTGVIWLLSTHNLGEDHEPDLTVRKSKGTRTVHVLHSEDNGKTWSKPVDITADVKKPQWTWYATGPGIGIQIKHGPHAGRLVIPCDHVTPDTQPAQGNSHVIFSDDHGKTWKLGGEPKHAWFNESQVVELSGGRLMLNMRLQKSDSTRDLPKARGVAISDDGGESFGADRVDSSLPDPRCQGSILRYSWADEGKSRIVFANVASTTERKHLKVRMSFDEGQTWPAMRSITDSWAGYSSLVRFGDGQMGLLYETGDEKLYERIELVRFNVDWLASGQDVDSLKWRALPDLPDSLGEAGAFAGTSNGAILFAGGANFPNGAPWRGGTKVFSSRVHVLTPGRKWIADAGTLTRPTAYGVSISTDRGVILIGGCDATRCFHEVQRMSWRADTGIRVEQLPPLPPSLAFATGALVGNTIYVIGGQERVDNPQATANVLALDLSREGSSDFGWQALDPLPGPPRVLAVSAAMMINGKPSLVVFSGRNVQPGETTKLLCDGYRLDVASQKWDALPPIQIDGKLRCVMAGNAIAIGGKIQLLGGDPGDDFAKAERLRTNKSDAQLIALMESHRGFSSSIIQFDPATNSYSVVGQMPDPSPVTAPCVEWNGGIALISGEFRAGVRTPKAWLGRFSEFE